ncbi:MAG: hypothetical protein M3Z23_01645 [Acidobacteriota bacterium]|nr:hypothetical protein [Acidobacteriota bacterium]
MVSALKQVVFWDYPRASWQYDVIVGIIVAFVLLTPRDWFRDQPRIPHGSEVAMLSSAQGSNVFWIEPELVGPIPESQRLGQLSQILKNKTGKQQQVTRLEPIYDSENEIKGYMAFAKP